MPDDLTAGLRRLSRRLRANLPDLATRPLAPLPGLGTVLTPRSLTPRPGKNATPGITNVAAFGDNPGALDMLLYVPREAPRPGCALLVLVHGCGQEAAQFAEDTGWMRLADQWRTPLIMPVQRPGNNHGRCFNWFEPEDRLRGSGEAQSIRAMIDHAQRRFRPDPRRIYIGGLSAGGAMATAMLAAYPDVFSAGAAFSGLPVGAATDVRTALSVMSGHGPVLTPETSAGLARALGPSNYRGTWPRLSVWQGGADYTVVPQNAEVLAQQFVALHGLERTQPREEHPAGNLRRLSWGDPLRPAVENWTVSGMNHGYPVLAGPVSDRYVLPIGFDATEAIARFFDA